MKTEILPIDFVWNDANFSKTSFLSMYEHTMDHIVQKQFDLLTFDIFIGLISPMQRMINM